MKKRIMSMVLLTALTLNCLAGCASGVEGDATKEESTSSGSAITTTLSTTAENTTTPQEDTSTSATETPKDTVYAPTDEIKSAGFDSCFIQINNDIFKQGGYMTVAELVEKYGDRYKITYEKGDYEDRKDYLIEQNVNFNHVSNVNPLSHWKYKYKMTLTPKYGKADNVVYAYIANLTSSDEKVPLGEAYVVEFSPKSSKTPNWIPQGIAADGEFVEYKMDDFRAYIESLGFSYDESASEYGGFGLEMDMKYFDYDISGDKGYCLCYVGEVNASGTKPIFVSIAFFDENTDKLKTVKTNLLGLLN